MCASRGAALKLGGDHRRCRACLRVGAAATVLGQAFGDHQTSLGRGLWAQGKEIAPLFRYALRVSRELLIESLGVCGVLAVERLFVHRSRCRCRAFEGGPPSAVGANSKLVTFWSVGSPILASGAACFDSSYDVPCGLRLRLVLIFRKGEREPQARSGPDKNRSPTDGAP